ILWAVERTAEAEEVLEKAVTLFEKVPDTWVALVQLQARSKGTDKVEATLKRASQKMPADQIPLVLAQCNEILGRLGQAEKQYEAVWAANPDSLSILRQVSDFYMRTGRPQLAEPHLRHIADPGAKASADELAWSRRNLAVAMAASGDYLRLTEAMVLIEQNFQGQRPTIEDQRAKSFVLAVTPGRRKEAMALLENAVSNRPPTENEIFFLARLYEAKGEWTDARSRLVRLVTSDTVQPQFLDSFIRSLLEHREIDEAQVWQARLEKIEPESFRTLELKARVLHAQGKTSDAVEVMQRFAEKKEADLRLVATVLDQLGQAHVAEKMYRRWASTTKAPEALLVLADFLGRQGKTDEALDLCQKALQAGVPVASVVRVSVPALRRSQNALQISKPIEQLLSSASGKDPKQTAYLIAMAEIRDLRGDYSGVKELYRKVLEL